MEIEEDAVYKVIVYLPEEFLEAMMDAIDDSMTSIYPGYDRTFSYFPVTGTWRPLEGSIPYTGSKGEVSVEREFRLEVAVFGSDILAVVKAIRSVHPYEVPAIDVLPMVSGMHLLDSHSSLGFRE